ncbi:MAG: Rne/Rng family ribonuclease [Rhodospirillaceae bacterium]
MTEELLIEVVPGQVRAALVADGRLVDLVIERGMRPSLVGNVYLGRVQRVLPGMDAAFVEVGIGRAGFLDLDGARPPGAAPYDGERIADHLSEGEALLVQVTRDAIGRKGVELDRRIALPGRLLVYAPLHPGIAVSRQIVDAAEEKRLAGIAAALAGEGEGFIVRTSAADATADEMAEDARILRSLWAEAAAAARPAKAPALVHAEPDALSRVIRDHAGERHAAIRIDSDAAMAAAQRFCRRHLPRLADRLVHHPGPASLFARHGVDEEIDRALSARVDLPSGGFLVIEPTEALTAVDVNTGSFVGDTRLAETVRRINLEAAEEVARQIRVRNLGGLIAVDFIHMQADADWEAVVGALRAAVTGDRSPCRVIGKTAAGLVEVTRRRRRESLLQLVTEACRTCAGTGRVRRAETVAYEILRALAAEAAVSPPGALTVRAADDVVALLEGELRPAFEGAVARTGRRVALRVEPGPFRDQFDIVLD